MKVSRTLAVCLCLAALGALLAGCGGGGSQYGDQINAGNANAIVFMRDIAGDKQIWVMDLDGSNKTLLCNPSGRAIQGELSPDGRKLVYVDQSDGHSIVKVKDLNTGDSISLYDYAGGGSDDCAPSWSPDGSKIAYHQEYGGRCIHIVNADGTGDTAVTTGGDDFAAAWSPDGSQLVFDRGWNGSIVRIDADGTDELVLVPQDDHNYGSPRFLLDGRIIFVQDANGEDGEVLVCNADGSGIVNLTNTADLMEFGPSSAGSAIAYSLADLDKTYKDVYIAGLSGNSLKGSRNLTGDVTDDCWRPRLGYLDKSYFNPDAMEDI